MAHIILILRLLSLFQLIGVIPVRSCSFYLFAQLGEFFVGTILLLVVLPLLVCIVHWILAKCLDDAAFVAARLE